MPFAEFNAGLLTHLSNWTASDPFDEEGYSVKERITTSRSLYGLIGLGINFQLSDVLAFALSTGFQNAGRVQFRNSKMNPEQLTYNMGHHRFISSRTPRQSRPSHYIQEHA